MAEPTWDETHPVAEAEPTWDQTQEAKPVEPPGLIQTGVNTVKDYLMKKYADQGTTYRQGVEDLKHGISSPALQGMGMQAAMSTIKPPGGVPEAPEGVLEKQFGRRIGEPADTPIRLPGLEEQGPSLLSKAQGAVNKGFEKAQPAASTIGGLLGGLKGLSHGPSGAMIGGAAGAAVGDKVMKAAQYGTNMAFNGAQKAADVLGESAATPYLKDAAMKGATALGADWLSQTVKNSPQSLGKWAEPLVQAAARKGNALGATDYLLQMNDENYREHMRQLKGSESPYKE